MTESRATLRIEERAAVRAPASRVYGFIADYHDGHPRILPPKYFRNMVVESGGTGAGTIVRFDMLVFGAAQSARGHVTEPEPGRVLLESYPDTGIVTTFVVNADGPSRTMVTIQSDIPRRAGLSGVVERAFFGWFLPRVFRAELAQIDRVASSGV